MHDFTQRGTFVSTYWKQTKAAPERDEWALFGVSLDKDGNDVELARVQHFMSVAQAALEEA